jgi:hypothetical protein
MFDKPTYSKKTTSAYSKKTTSSGIVQPYNEKGGNIFRKRISGKTSRPFSGYDIFFQALSLEIFIHNTAG